MRAAAALPLACVKAGDVIVSLAGSLGEEDVVDAAELVSTLSGVAASDARALVVRRGGSGRASAGVGSRSTAPAPPTASATPAPAEKPPTATPTTPTRAGAGADDGARRRDEREERGGAGGAHTEASSAPTTAATEAAPAPAPVARAPTGERGVLVVAAPAGKLGVMFDDDKHDGRTCVVVVGMRDTSPLAEALRVGDIVRRCDGEPVRGATDASDPDHESRVRPRVGRTDGWMLGQGLTG